MPSAVVPESHHQVHSKQELISTPRPLNTESVLFTTSQLACQFAEYASYTECPTKYLLKFVLLSIGLFWVNSVISNLYVVSAHIRKLFSPMLRHHPVVAYVHHHQ
jgi:hypothetical protein